jgi:integrase
MDLSTMGSRLTKRLRAEIGIDMNLHLFRHFGAMLYLEAHPGQYEVVRRLLGHRELSQTLNAYVGFEAGTATRLFAETVMAARS